jgi:hypothetical protein
MGRLPACPQAKDVFEKTSALAHALSRPTKPGGPLFRNYDSICRPNLTAMAQRIDKQRKSGRRLPALQATLREVGRG